jgi:hypothetical protein
MTDITPVLSFTNNTCDDTFEPSFWEKSHTLLTPPLPGEKYRISLFCKLSADNESMADRLIWP